MLRKTVAMAFAAISFLSCTGVPGDLKPVQDFEVERYLGKWYEIARLDHKFERNMNNVSATYTASQSGEIQVVNRGYDAKSGQWKSIQGVARPIGNENTGSLKVSFFGPFYGGYHVVDLDHEKYKYAMVVGPSRSYFWILSRDKEMDAALLDQLLTRASGMGIDTKKIILVEQSSPEG